MLLDSKKIAEIDAKASEVLLDVFGQEDIALPVNISTILEAKGVNLQYGKFERDDVSGALDRTINTIFISEKEPYARQAFTIAHELGHILMHNTQKEVFYRVKMNNLDTETEKEETEANCFAASLLMPASYVKKYWTLSKNPKIISSIFGVSSSAMFFRLKHLGLL